jgi:hypothetical protein
MRCPSSAIDGLDPAGGGCEAPPPELAGFVGGDAALISGACAAAYGGLNWPSSGMARRNAATVALSGAASAD